MASKRRRLTPQRFCALPTAYIEVWHPHIGPIASHVFVVIARATWGYQKETDVLALTEIARRANLPLRTVNRAMAILRLNGLITCEGPARHAKAITIVMSRLLDKPGSAIQALRNVLEMPAGSATVALR